MPSRGIQCGNVLLCPVAKGTGEEMGRGKSCYGAVFREHNTPCCSETGSERDMQAALLARTLLTKTFPSGKQAHPLGSIGIMEVSTARHLPKPH